MSLFYTMNFPRAVSIKYRAEKVALKQYLSSSGLRGLVRAMKWSILAPRSSEGTFAVSRYLSVSSHAAG